MKPDNNLPSWTALSRAVFLLDFDRNKSKGERRMESTHGNGSLLGAENPTQSQLLGQPITCRLGELRPHPSYVRLGLTVPAFRLSALAEEGELTFREPLVITREHIIIDGYARWELARRKGRATLPCLEYDLSEEDALRWLLLRHCRSNGLNDFCRILLALELESCFREKGLSNQQAGGQSKGSSKLTEADRIDVRKKIAEAAGVSVGNMTKVKQLVTIAHPELLEALRAGEVSIHRAWKWSVKSQERQTEALRTYRAEKGVNRAIRDLISRHDPRSLPIAPDLEILISRLSQLKAGECGPIDLSVIRLPGKTIFVTERATSIPPTPPGVPSDMNSNLQPLKQILIATRAHWDRPEIRPAVRENFEKMINCRTPALGAEILASETEEKLVYHTCKSRSCPSCGQRATLLWQREQWSALPDIPYSGMGFTMPCELWPIFRRNRHLLHDLPAVASAVIQQWVKMSRPRTHCGIPPHVRPAPKFQCPSPRHGICWRPEGVRRPVDHSATFR